MRTTSGGLSLIRALSDIVRSSLTSRYQAGPTLRSDWQVLDLTTGASALMSNLQLNSMSQDEAIELSALLNELEMEAQETTAATKAPTTTR